VEELGVGNKATGSALWLVGALQMAAAGQLFAAINFGEMLRQRQQFHPRQKISVIQPPA
jgi:hypothetical protein